MRMHNIYFCGQIYKNKYLSEYPSYLQLFYFFFFFHRKSQDSQKELKLLLDVYKSAPKEQRDKVQVRVCPV